MPGIRHVVPLLRSVPVSCLLRRITSSRQPHSAALAPLIHERHHGEHHSLPASSCPRIPSEGEANPRNIASNPLATSGQSFQRLRGLPHSVACPVRRSSMLARSMEIWLALRKSSLQFSLSYPHRRNRHTSG